MYGKVYLTGAGPGDPDLLTVKALRLIRQADVIVYDRLINGEILREAKKEAILVYVGKENNHHTLPQEEINALLVAYAHTHETIVRLKGGDPLVFGRGGEEALYLSKNGITFEFVPGISSAIAVPAYAGIPLTHRGINTSFRVITGHQASTGENFNAGVLRKNETLVILMGLHRLEKIIRSLLNSGLPSSTPCAIIENGTMNFQKQVFGTLNTIIEVSRDIHSPAIIVVGETVSLHNRLNWFHYDAKFSQQYLSR
ncbi:uroporphyrinogen-III C-methyltransferase [Sulfuricurvum sp.]|uniref:uroporphyrinogen-III C-methyltransferase n=1 Tax=Sulfuricurvum sp. TaxID=2025608 RepID=UPI002623761D|nr:uroporphyrinogen-III C-methyltransferase [Sulfuricurvum sp.]MDD4950335.1 uroporphyrinogen-III C-methyltransferase [Sulfuricurvum sp.]